MSLYTDLIEAGCEVSNWQSDLYVVRNDTALEIFKRHKQKPCSFISAVDGTPMLEAPFQFDPFWESRQPRKHHDHSQSAV